MVCAWITRNYAGIVTSFSAVAYTDRETLDEWASDDRKPELVEANRITLNAPLPPDARVIDTSV